MKEWKDIQHTALEGFSNMDPSRISQLKPCLPPDGKQDILGARAAATTAASACTPVWCPITRFWHPDFFGEDGRQNDPDLVCRYSYWTTEPSKSGGVIYTSALPAWSKFLLDFAPSNSWVFSNSPSCDNEIIGLLTPIQIPSCHLGWIMLPNEFYIGDIDLYKTHLL